MKSIAAGKFKDGCLRIMDAVAKTRTPVIVTKRGRPVVRVVPYVEHEETDLSCSILKESGDLFSTGEKWNADIS